MSLRANAALTALNGESIHRLTARPITEGEVRTALGQLSGELRPEAATACNEDRLSVQVHGCWVSSPCRICVSRGDESDAFTLSRAGYRASGRNQLTRRMGTLARL